VRSGERPRDRLSEEEELIFLTAVAGRSRVATGASQQLLTLQANVPVMIAQNYSPKPLYVEVRTNAISATFRVGNDDGSARSGPIFTVVVGNPDSFVPFTLLQGERVYLVSAIQQSVVVAQLVL